MRFKFKNVVTLIIETFYFLLITFLLGNSFNVKQIDDIFVMASTIEKSIPSTTMSNGAPLTTAVIITTPITLPSTATATSAPLSNTLFDLQANTISNTNGIYNATFAQTTDESASNDIDTLKDDSDDYERGLLRNYIMTKHITLSNTSTTQLPLTKTIKTTVSTLTATTSTARQISPIIDPAKVTTNPTSKTGQLLSNPTSSSSSLLLPDGNRDDAMRLLSNNTHSDVLASLSLLSSTLLNESIELKSISSTSYTLTSSASTFTSTTASVSSPTQEMPAIALKHKGNKYNMHNTNSHLSVDNVNAIVTTNRITTTATATTSKQQEQQHQQLIKNGTSTKLSTQKAYTIAKGSTSDISNSSNSTSSDISSSSSSSSVDGSVSKTNFTMEELITGNGNSNRSNMGITRISARKVDSKTSLPKAHKTDAPMLNYIFDTFSSANKHHHHDQRYGPHFEDAQLVGQPTNMTVQAGSSIHLNCRISLLQDKTVSWVRRNAQGENALDLLTVGLHTYTGDKRYKMEFQYPSNWRLKIINVKKDDEATYECQISTHPPRVIQINLYVNAPKVMIVDEFGDPLQEKYYEQDSTLQLSCVVRNVAMSSSVVFWKHSEDILNYDVTRGGVSVKTELMDDGANSTLFIAKINKADSGNYTCSISEYQNYTIAVHILNGESFAELHHGAAFSWQQLNYQTWLINLVLATIFLLFSHDYTYR